MPDKCWLKWVGEYTICTSEVCCQRVVDGHQQGIKSFLEQDLYANILVFNDSMEEVGIGNVEAEEQWVSVS